LLPPIYKWRRMAGAGGPEEDRSNGFKWAAVLSLLDELMNNTLGKIMSTPFDLLLGRRTYEIFAAHWPIKIMRSVKPSTESINMCGYNTH